MQNTQKDVIVSQKRKKFEHKSIWRQPRISLKLLNMKSCLASNFDNPIGLRNFPLMIMCKPIFLEIEKKCIYSIILVGFFKFVKTYENPLPHLTISWLKTTKKKIQMTILENVISQQHFEQTYT